MNASTQGIACAALRLVAAPKRSESASKALSSWLRCTWPLLTSDDALECRVLSTGECDEVYLVLGASRVTEQVANAAVGELAESVASLLTATLPEWEWAAVSSADLLSVVQPFKIADGGDLERQEISVAFTGDRVVDMPALGGGGDGDSLNALIEAMAAFEAPTLVTITAQPAHVDEFERRILAGEFRNLDSEGVFTRETSQAEVELAKATLGYRLAAAGGLAQLRYSVASAAQLPVGIVTLATTALSPYPGGLTLLRPETEADREAFATNLADLTFNPWGPLIEPGREDTHIGDAYLSSFEEVAAAWVVPQPDGFLPIAAELRDPPSRPVGRAVPTEGLAIGANRYGSESRPVALEESDRSRHLYVVGQTGTGKSTLLLNMIMQDIEQGMGLAVVDPHGDLVDDILARFPESRADDLILIDPSDTERPVPLNIIESGTPAEQDFLIQSMLDMLYRIYDPGHTGIVGPRFEHWFRNSALTVMANPKGACLLDIPKVFVDDAFLAEMLAEVRDPVVRSFWLEEMAHTSDYHISEMLGWFNSKFGAFMTNQMMRDIVGQRHSTYSMREAMDTGKVVLVRLPKGLLGDINLKWLGMIAIAKIQKAAMSRASVPRDQRRPFALYVDEFQNFSVASFDQMIAEARKYGLWLTMAHQHVGQLDEAFRTAVFGNVGAIATFRLGASDSELVSGELSGYQPSDLVRLENYRAVVRLAVGGRVQPPFDVFTAPAPPLGNPELAAVIQEAARLKYGRAVELVEAEVLESYVKSR